MWKSQRQSVVALSSAEAEMIAMTEATREVIHTRRLLAHLDSAQPDPTPLFCDSQAAIAAATGNGTSPRRKHIDVKYYFVREQQKEGIINIEWVGTAAQPADILTKPLPVDAFERHRQFIMNLKDDAAAALGGSRSQALQPTLSAGKQTG